MCMQDRAGAALFDDADVQQAFVRWFDAVIANHVGVFVYCENLLRCEFAFVDAARAHREVERFALDHGTQVTAGAE
jgi:hypothetical protein